MGVGLLCLQIGLGAGNVVWQLPTLLREAHAANAAATFVVFIVAAAVAAIEAASPKTKSANMETVRGETITPSRLHGLTK
jgi:heme A synthase